MKKNPHDKILKGKLKERYLITVPESYFFTSIYACVYIQREKSYATRRIIGAQCFSATCPLSFLLHFSTAFWYSSLTVGQLFPMIGNYIFFYIRTKPSQTIHIYQTTREKQKSMQNKRNQIIQVLHIYIDCYQIPLYVLSTYVYIDLYFEPIIMSFEISLQPNKTIGSHKSPQE